MLFNNHTFNQRYNMSISGGGKIARYYVAAAYNKDNGIIQMDKRNNFNNNISINKYILRSNINIDLTKSTEIIVRLHGAFDDYSGPLDGGSSLYEKALNASPVLFQPYYPADEANKYTSHILFGNYGEGNYSNPYADMVKGYQEYSRSTMLAQFEAKQKLDFITEGLSARALFNVNRYSKLGNSNSYKPFYYSYSANPDSPDLYKLTALNPDGGTEYLEFATGAREVTSTLYFEGALAYQREFNDKHNVSGMLVYTMRDYVDSNAETLQLALPHRNIGLAGRFTYGYDSRYFVEGNFGYNGSENFAPGKRYGFFPAGSIGWVVSEEEFMKKASWIDFLKVRASYGLVGSDNVSSRFPYLAFYGGGSGYDFGNNFGTNVGGTSEGNLANANLTWEKARKLNVGIDFTTLNQRLALTIDAFYEYRFDIITDMNSDGIMGYPDIVGKDAALQNLGEVSNRGVDIELSWNDKIGKDFRYYIRPNLTFSRNRLEYKAEVARKNSWRKETGKRLYENFVYVFDHFVADQEEADRLNKIGYQPWGQLIPGDVVYKDLDRNGVIDDEDRTAMGNPRSPELMFGIPFGFQYKNFDFSVLLQGATKSSILLNGAAVFDFPQFEQDKIGRVKKMHLDRWTPETAATAKYPALHYGTHDNNKNGNSSLFLYDASYLRLKNVEIGYNVSPKLLRKFHVQQARIYVQGLNLLTFDKLGDVDIDPETKSGDGASWYPIQKVFNFGIDITF